MHSYHVQKTYQDLYEETERRAKTLEDQGYKVVSMWEHKFDRLVRKNPQLHQFIQDLDIQDPFNPRDALYRGWTNGTRLYCNEEDMQYADVCSLYPYVLKYKPFPVGHPQIITLEFRDGNECFGLIRCRVFPPRGLYYLVLPYKTGGKSLFPLCHTCAEQRNQGPDDHCQDTGSKRSLTGTWVISELQKA
jgi:hypothetical protein